MEKTPHLSGEHTFDCQMYVSGRGVMTVSLPYEDGPTRIARLRPLDYDELVDPGFRKLLAAFESLPKPLNFVQV
jgi:hypothetical protein